MENSLYVALSSQIALEKRLSTLADNVANSGTVGFRSTEVKFEDLVSSNGPADFAFVSSGKDYLSTKAGGYTQTGNALDFAVRGEAWFAIETPAGTALTRDGRFKISETGELQTLLGYPVLDAGEGPIEINAENGPVVASSDGVLTQDGVPVATLGLFQAKLDQGYTRFENSAIIPNTPAEPLVDTFGIGVVQGYLEESNVNPVAEMTRLIMVSRAFEFTTSLIRDGEKTIEQAISTLGGQR